MSSMKDVNDNNQEFTVRPNGSLRATTINGTETKTDQSFKEMQNVNNIMKKYRAVGINYNNMPNAAKGVYGDFSDVKDYRTAMQASLDVQHAFMQLPSDIRKRFQNDPQELAEFLNDPKNHEEAKRIGLLKETIIPEKELDVLKGIRNALDKRDDDSNNDAKNKSKDTKKTTEK